MSGKTQQPGGSRPLKSKFMTQFEDVAASMKQLAEFKKELNSFGSFVEEKQLLEEKLQKAIDEASTKEKEFSKAIALKDKEIANLQNRKTVLFEEFGAELVTLKSGAETQSNLETRVKDLEQELNHVKSAYHTAQREILKLKGAVEGRDASLTKVKETLKQKETTLKSKMLEMDGTRSELERCHTLLEEERAVMGWETLDARHQTELFDSLAQNCRKIAKQYFQTKLPLTCNPGEVSEALRVSGFYSNVSTSFPMSSSLPSQYLRLAVAQNIISRELCTSIFKPYYQPRSFPDRYLIDELLHKIRSTNPRRGAIFRQAVVCAYEGDEATTYENKLVELTSDRISKTLAPLLFTFESQQNFMADLQNLLQEAVELWKSIQRCDQQGGADVTPKTGWSADIDYDQIAGFPAGQEISAAPHSYPILTIFPRIIVGNSTIHPGCAVWSSQNMVIAANHEIFQSTSYGREFSAREERRLSSANSSTVEEGLSTSPSSSRRSNSNRSSRIQGRNLGNHAQFEEASKSLVGSKDRS